MKRFKKLFDNFLLISLVCSSGHTLSGCRKVGVAIPEPIGEPTPNDSPESSGDLNKATDPSQTSPSPGEEAPTVPPPVVVVLPPSIDPAPVEPKPDPTKVDPAPEPPITKKPDPVIPEPTPAPVKPRYMIVGDSSKRCITSPETVNTQFEIRDCFGTENQLFTLEQISTNVMKIITHRGHVLEVKDNSLYDLAVVQTGLYTGLSTQSFKIEAKHFTGFYAVNVNATSYALDAAYKNDTNGTKVIVWRTDSPAANQRWQIKQVALVP